MSLRKMLREGTAESHQRLDETAGQVNAFKSLANYAGYLDALDQLYIQFGPSLDWASQEARLEPISDRLRQGIASDLGEISRANSQRLPLEWTTIRQDLSSVPEENRWAAAYVLEGSAMGARQMLDSALAFVRESLGGQDSAQSGANTAGGQPTPGASYWQLLTSASLDRWSPFIESLQDSPTAQDPELSRACVSAAVGVFDVAHRVFSQVVAKRNNLLT